MGEFIKTSPANAVENTITPDGDFTSLTLQGITNETATQLEIIPGTGQTGRTFRAQLASGGTALGVRPVQDGGLAIVTVVAENGEVPLGVTSNDIPTSQLAQFVGNDSNGDPAILSVEGGDAVNPGYPTIVMYAVLSNGGQFPAYAILGQLADDSPATPAGRIVIETRGNVGGGSFPAIIAENDGSEAEIGFLGAAAVVRQVGASAAGIAAIVDPNAKAAVQALQTALSNLGLVTSPA